MSASLSGSACFRKVSFKPMKYLFVGLLFLMLAATAGSRTIQPLAKDKCEVYGLIYIEEKDRAYADYRVYVEENESMADLPVFLEDNSLYADRSGMWYFTKNRNEAHYRIFLEKNKSFADFSVFYTNTRSFAGCR